MFSAKLLVININFESNSKFINFFIILFIILNLSSILFLEYDPISIPKEFEKNRILILSIVYLILMNTLVIGFF